MSTGVRGSGAASRNRSEKRQLHGWEDVSEALQRRPEVRINNHAIQMVNMQSCINGMGALALLWATVVLLGGFVSDMKWGDFRTVTIIAFMQAVGLFDRIVQSEDRRAVWMKWIALHGIRSVRLGRVIVFFAVTGPSFTCLVLAMSRGTNIPDGADRDTSKANMNPALNLFYLITLAHGSTYIWYMLTELYVNEYVIWRVSGQNGFSPELLRAYFHKTKEMCANNPASIRSWNLIIYGASLLDSQLPEDYVAGGRVLTMLIDLGTPVAWLLSKSPRQRIQKVIGTLAWRNAEDREIRWLAARIMGNLAGHLNLRHFPGALECISSLFDTSCQEILNLPFLIERNKTFVACRIFRQWVRKKDRALEDSGSLEQDDNKQRENCEGINAELILPGLRILENLAYDRHNCTLIYNTKDLLSKIVAPVSSNEFVQDIKSNAAWTKVVEGSLKVVTRLMGSSGSAGKKMCRLIANDSNAVKNLEAVLDMDMKSNDAIIELQMRAIEVLTKLALNHSESTSATNSTKKLIERMLQIFLTKDWMEDYLKYEKRKIEKAKETAIRLKDKAGEALTMLSSDSKAIKSFTGCNDDDIHRLTQLLDSNIKIIECKISATETVEIGINIGCRTSAAIILRHLSNYVKAPTLRKVLEQLLPVQQAQVRSTRTIQWWEHATCCISKDIQNPSGGGQNEPFTLWSHIKQCRERRLQAELLSLVVAIRANNNLNLAGILLSQTPPDTPEDFVVRLKKMVEDNMYATPACLAILKLTCEMVIEFLKHDRNVQVINNHDIVGTLLEASKVMAGIESTRLFTGLDHDCCGLPLKPLSSVLAKNVEDLLTQRKQDLGINIMHVGASSP